MAKDKRKRRPSQAREAIIHSGNVQLGSTLWSWWLKSESPELGEERQWRDCLKRQESRISHSGDGYPPPPEGEERDWYLLPRAHWGLQEFKRLSHQSCRRSQLLPELLMTRRKQSIKHTTFSLLLPSHFLSAGLIGQTQPEATDKEI